MGDFIWGTVRFFSWVAGWVAAVSALLVLYGQFQGRPAAGAGTVLAIAVGVWWLRGVQWIDLATYYVDRGGSAPWSTRWVGPTRRQRYGNAVQVAAWLAQGGLLVAATVYYTQVRPERPQWHGFLLAAGAALLGCHLVRRHARRLSAGPTAPPPLWALGWWPGAVMVARWVGYLALSGAAQSVGYWIAVAVYAVPVGAIAEVHSWWSSTWLTVPADVVVVALWAMTLARLAGVAHVFYGHRQFGSSEHQSGFYSSRSRTHDTGYVVPRPRTGLRALAQLQWLTDSTQETRSMTTGGGSRWHQTFDTVSTTDVSGRVHLWQLPPEYLPRWAATVGRWLRVLPRDANLIDDDPPDRPAAPPAAGRGAALDDHQAARPPLSGGR